MVALQSIHDELRSTQDELTDITRVVSRIQDRLTNIIRRSEDESRSLEERMADLETDKQDMSRELEGLWELNQELQETANSMQPQTERAVDARNAALRKLHHARKVIRDLLDERRIGLVAEYEGWPSPISNVEGREAERLHVELLGSLLEGDSDSSKSSSEDTVRAPSVVADIPEVSREEVVVMPSRKGGETSASGRELGSSGQAGRIKTTATSTSSDPGPWRIHYSRPPLSIAIACGPMPWSDLARRLSLDDAMIASLERLADIKEHGLRIQTLMDELVFVYDPIILEGPLNTHLIDWGHMGWNTQAVAYLTRGRKMSPMFHTFFFPVKKDGWYYFGAMTWTPVQLWSMWPKLSGESKAKLIAKLKDRCGGKVGKEKIVGMIEEGRLQQICFEISGEANKAASCSFAMKMGFRKGGSNVLNK